MSADSDSHSPAPGTVRSLIPARIDRLPWSPFHTRLVLALGVAWILDGLEITVASTAADFLSKPETLNLSVQEVGLFAAIYLLGEVAGALYFGRQSDRLGRRRLFVLTLAVYLFGSFMTALTLGSGAGWLVFLYVTRFIAGGGIGGEYAAINSAIDELIPSRYRGRVDIAVNGTYGPARWSGHWATCCSSTNWTQTGPGGPVSCSVRCSAWSSCTCGGTCRRALVGKS